MSDFEHTTYNMTFALVSFTEGFEVYVCHPPSFPDFDETDEDKVRLWNEEEIEDCEGHLFLIKKRD